MILQRKLSILFLLPGNLTSCSALYMYSPVDGSLRAIEVNWTPILVTIMVANNLLKPLVFNSGAIQEGQSTQW